MPAVQARRRALQRHFGPASIPARAAPQGWLGGLLSGDGAFDRALAAACAAQPARPLAGGGPVPAVDAWSAAGPLRSGRHGPVRWRDDGHWLWAALEVDADACGGLHAAAVEGYRALFATLAAAGVLHPLRLWNYLPRIHEEEAGLERYRAFNAGRQQAFLESGAAAFDGAPAACALGVPDGPLTIRCLAGRSPGLAIENPRQVSAYRYPSDYGPRAPSFSRAALAMAADGEPCLFVSGTASIVGHESLHDGDLAAQTDETLANLRAVVDAASARAGRRFDLSTLDLTVYLRDPAAAETTRAHLAAAFGADAPAVRGALLLQADVCRRELLIEIEAHGAPASDARSPA